MPNISHSDGDQWLIFQNDQLLIIRHQTGIALPNANDMLDLKSHMIREHFIGQFNSASIYCAELHPILSVQHAFEAVPLRKALDYLGEDWYSIATKAFTIINWDRNHQYCGRCGKQTIHKIDSFERSCLHCELSFHPRISPSIIVLIRNSDHVLMARSYHFQPGIYGLIAGFIEAGENIEDTVHREIYEETRIRIKNLHYYGSQAWPFPDSLMIGFFADYASGELNIENDEIEHAGWYRYDNLPGRPSSRISIASKMLDHFIAEQVINS